MVIVGGISSPALSSKPSQRGLPALTASRCQVLQDFITKSKTVDGIVCVNGIDSRYSPDAKNFTNFLLFGCSNYKKGSHSRFQNVDTDELIIVVKAQTIHVYGVPSIINMIMPQLSRMNNLELLCLNDIDNVSEDIIEDHKIHSFINMTRDLANIAIPYSSQNTAPFSPMVIEQWPIIQAYALEDYGGNGFFTLSHELSGFCFDALNLFQNFDLGSIRNVLSDSCLQIQYHWSTLIKNIQLSIQHDFSIDLEAAIEPLVSYTLHGNVNSQKPLVDLCNHPVTKKPFYVTCSLREPMGSVSCGRTYFVCDKTTSPDLILVNCIYEAAVVSAHKSIQHFITSLNPSKLQSYFTKKFLDKLESYKYPELAKYSSKQLKVEVLLTAFDVKGKLVNLTNKEYLPIMKCMTVKIKNIQSLEKKAFVYKDIIFEETFIDSSLRLANEDTISRDNDHIVMTDAIPTFVQWNQHQKTEKLKTPCSLFSQYPDVYDSDCVLEDSSITVFSQYAAPLCLNFSSIKEVKVLRHSNLAILMYMEHSQICLPPFSKRLCLVFWQRGNGFKFATETLMSRLRDVEVKIEQEGIPDDLINKFTNLVSSKALGIAGPSDELKTILSQFPTYSSFESHFILSSSGSDIVYKPQDLAPMSDPIEPVILVTILIGIPGSNQEKISSLITNFSKDENRFIILRQPFGSEEMYSGENLSKSLAMLVDRAQRQPNAVTRVMVIVSAYVEIYEVICTITNHPNSDVSEMCRISCVNTCIDVRNLHISNKTFFPKVLEQCRDGWTNNIIVSGTRKGSSEDFRLLRSINQTANIIEVVGNQCISAENIDAICSEDAFNGIDFAFDRHVSCPGWFNGQYKPNPPYLDVEQISVKFDAPLCKARFMAQLKALHQKEGKVFVDRIVMKGSVFYLRGRTSFSDDENLYEVECTPRSGVISIDIVPKNKSMITPTPPGHKASSGRFCFTFTGHHLSVDQIKAWLQSCVVKPPTKKEKLTKATLSESEISKLKEQVRKDPLPEGWFYNGSQYVSIMEGKSIEHPLLGDVVESYLLEKNKEIDKFNLDVDNYKRPMLFEGM